MSARKEHPQSVSIAARRLEVAAKNVADAIEGIDQIDDLMVRSAYSRAREVLGMPVGVSDLELPEDPEALLAVLEDLLAQLHALEDVKPAKNELAGGLLIVGAAVLLWLLSR